MSKKIKNEQKKFLGETLNQYDKALNEGINQLDKKNREQNHKISSLVNSFDNEYLEKDVEGNMTALENSKDGMVIINEIQGSTEVNYCKDGEKELILNGDIDTQGESSITLTEGVDGGLVDVSLEGNTEINLSKTKDPVLVTREFDDINCNTGKLQYTIDDVTTINDEPGKVDIDRIIGDTMVNHAVNGSEELILNAHIDESGDNSIKLNGVTSDGGKVDVYLEGNTLVNVSNVKDDYITPTIEDKVDQGSVISLPEVSEGLIHIDEIEGNTLVNYCTDGAKELTLNGDIDVEGTFVTTTEGVDNGLVDIMCEGNTLVNIVTEYELGFVNASRVDDQYVKLQHGSNENTCYITLPYGSCLYKPRTTYTLVVDIKENTSTARLGMSNIGSVISKVSSRDIGKDPGKYFITFETKDDFSTDNRGVNAPVNDIYFCSWDKGGDGSKHIIFRFFILEGDWTDKEIPSYFEGMKSVGQDDENGHKIEIVSSNSNLLDNSTYLLEGSNPTITLGKVYNDNARPTHSNGRVIVHFPCKPNTKYYLVAKGTKDRANIVGTLNKDKVWVANNVMLDYRVINNVYQITTTSDSYYLEWYLGQNADDLVHDVILSEIPITTDEVYKEAQSNKKEILLNEPLRSLPNGVKDRFVKIGGKWFIERKCAEAILNGSESWSDTTSITDESNLICWYNLPNGKIATYTQSDRFVATYRNGGTNIDWSKESIFSGNAISGQPGRIALSISKSKLVSSDVQGFKTWLANNPTKVVYELATPTYEPLEIEPTLNTYNDTTHISNNSIIPCNMQIKNTGYNAIIKPSTLYTVAVDTNKNGEIGINLGGAEITTTNNVATITTPETLTDDSLRLHGKGIKGSKVRLLEGDKTNWIPSYFEGMKSSFEDKVQEDGSYKMEILMNNKNLIDYNQAIRNSGSVHYEIDRNNSNIVAYSMESSPWQNVQVSLNLSNGKTYTLSYETLEYQSTNGVDVDINYYVAIYETIPNREIVHINYATKNTTFTVPKDVNAKDLGLRIHITQRTSDMATIKVNGLMVTESNQKLDFAPPISNKIQLSSIEPLRGVGDVHDRLVFKDGKLMIERNCTLLQLTRDIPWSLNNTYKDADTIQFTGFLSEEYNINSAEDDVLCDKKPVYVSNYVNNSIWVYSGKTIVMQMNYNFIKTLEDFYTWLDTKKPQAVLKLKTPTYEEISYDLKKIILESYTNGTLFFDTNIPPTKVSFNCFEEELTYLYPATSYTVQFVSDRTTTVNITLGGTQLLAQNIISGLNRISITTPATLIDNKLIIDGTGAKISNVVVTDTDREFKYFEGMKSVGECEGLEVKSINANLFRNPNIQFNNLRYLGNNEYVSTNQWGTICAINVTPGEKYTFCYKIKSDETVTSNGTSFFRLNNPNGTIVGNTALTETVTTDYVEYTSTFIPNYAYVEVCIRNSVVKTLYVKDIMIMKGEGKVYTPPKENKQQLTHEPLRGIGDYRDRYVLIDGKWYIERNVGLLDCTKIGVWNKGNGGEFYRYGFLNDIKTEFSNDISNHCKFSCNTYPVGKVSDESKGLRQVAIYNHNGDLKGQIRILEPSCNTVDEFYTYMQNNPTYVTYPKNTTYEPINYNPLVTYSDITHITTNSTIPTNITIKNHGYNLVALKENTQYTLYVNKDTTNALTYRLGDYVEINSLSKFTFTTPSALTDKTLRIDGKGVKVNDLMLVEGTPTNDSIGYFDGLKSSYECEKVTDKSDENYGKYKVDVKVVGKNLCNITKRIQNVYINNLKYNYTITPNADFDVLVVYIKNIDSITISINTGRFEICRWEDTNGNLIQGEHSLYSKSQATLTPPKTNCVLKICVNKTFINNNIQIEEGNTATEYEPYFESKQTVYLNSPLLKGDEIVWKDNKIQHYHKMKAVVFDGSDDEEWRRQPELDNDTTERYWIEKINNNQLLDVKINTISYNDKFDNIAKNNTCLYTHSTSARVDLRRLKTDNRWTDLNSLKQWLQANPVTVVYELGTPYYEEISDYPLKLNVIANSSLSTESTIQVTNISFNIYEETLPYLYPNTKYYITFNADVDRNNIIIDLGGNHVVFDCKVGFNKVEITTPSDTTNLLTFSGTGVNIDHVKVTQQDIDEYFEGMKSVGECEDLEITSANSDNTLSNTQRLTHEPLRGINHIKDRYVIIDGKWYIERNIIKYVLNGNEAWSEYYQFSDDEVFACYHIVNEYIVSNSFKCDKFKKTVFNANDNSEGVDTYYVNNTNYVPRLKIKKDKLPTPNIDGLKAWLRQNPITIIARLATPVYEPLDYNPFETYSGVTHISTNSLIPTNIVVKNHGYNCILKPSTKYTVALNKSNGTISAKLGGSAKVDSTNNIFTITTPSTLNDNVLRLSGSGNVKDIMILEGDKTVNTPSYFEGIESVFEQEYDVEKGKYKVDIKVVNEDETRENNIIFYIEEPLRVKDKVFIEDSKVVVERNHKEVTLDGSENWIYMNHNASGLYIRFRVDNFINVKTSKSATNLSNMFNCYNDTVLYNQNLNLEGFATHLSAKRLWIQINKAKLQTQDVVGFKQWLQQNPTTVIYELAEPVYEEVDCDLSKLTLENYSNSSLILDTNIPPTVDIRYSGEVPIVSQAKTLSSQVDNTTLDINENIIPYMCDIDYRIVELQLMNGDTQGEGIELLGIGDIEILGNENVLFNNREDKKYNYSYDMLKRDILSQRYSKEEYQYRLDRYLLANKISDEEYKELEGLLNNGE